MADGGLQPLVNVPALACVAVPPDLAPERAALAETLSVAVRALHQARLEPGERVAVFGGGAVGLLAVQAARAMGAGAVTLVEPIAARRALGAGTDDGRWDVVVECSGTPAAVTGAVGAARRAGRIALVGINRASLLLDTWDVVAKEKELIGSFSHVWASDFVGAIGMLMGNTISHVGMITRVPLSRSLDDGLLAFAEHPDTHLKIVVVPDDPAESDIPR